MVPFWRSNTMQAESFLFIARADGAPAGTLLFTPEAVVSVTSAAEDVVYEPTRDYVVDAARRRIVRPAGSRIPLADPSAIAEGNVSLIHAQLSHVTYTHRERWAGFVPEFGGDRLARTIARLQKGQPVTICVIGDSIAEGYDASGFHGWPPAQPPFASLVADSLTKRCGSAIQLHNLATAGSTAADGRWDTDRIAAQNPDLVVVAYGMNDATYAEVGEFVDNVSAIVATVRQSAPPAEFLLVSPMLPTPECTWVARERFDAYRQGLSRLTGPGLALADVTAVWHDMAARKDLRELTGNGLNHPNDFGHRVYAQAILAAISASW